MRGTSILALAGALAALFAAGCGGNDNKSSSSSPASSSTPAKTTTTASSSGAAKGKTLEVRLENIAFSPKSATAKVGEKVVWENYDTVAHNVVATSGETFKSKTLNKGDKFQYTVDKPGKIDYVCTFHPNMTATLTVTK
jgi:plastocyanin